MSSSLSTLRGTWWLSLVLEPAGVYLSQWAAESGRHQSQKSVLAVLHDPKAAMETGRCHGVVLISSQCVFPARTLRVSRHSSALSSHALKPTLQSGVSLRLSTE